MSQLPKTVFRNADPINAPVGRITQIVLASGAISALLGEAPSVDYCNDEFEWLMSDSTHYVTLGWPNSRQLQVTIWREPPDNEQPLPPVLAAVRDWCNRVELPFREDTP